MNRVAAAIRSDGDRVCIDVIVKARASRARLGPMQGDRIAVAVTAPPVEGAANDAVIALLSRALRRPLRDVAIASGKRSRRKTVCIRGATAAEVEAVLR